MRVNQNGYTEDYDKHIEPVWENGMKKIDWDNDKCPWCGSNIQPFQSIVPFGDETLQFEGEAGLTIFGGNVDLGKIPTEVLEVELWECRNCFECGDNAELEELSKYTQEELFKMLDEWLKDWQIEEEEQEYRVNDPDDTKDDLILDDTLEEIVKRIKLIIEESKKDKNNN